MQLTLKWEFSKGHTELAWRWDGQITRELHSHLQSMTEGSSVFKRQPSTMISRSSPLPLGPVLLS